MRAFLLFVSCVYTSAVCERHLNPSACLDRSFLLVSFDKQQNLTVAGSGDFGIEILGWLVHVVVRSNRFRRRCIPVLCELIRILSGRPGVCVIAGVCTYFLHCR